MSRRLSHSPPYISCLPPSVFFSVTPDHRLGFTWIMASTPPSTTSSAVSTPAAVDSAALCPCPKCRRRMSSLKHDSHTICSQCRDVNCSVDTCCSKCKSWSVEAMQEHLKYQRSLAGKRSSKKSAVTAASVSQPAVASRPIVASYPFSFN